MLSKSKFTRGIKCHKSLWLYFNKRDEQVIDDSTQSIFVQGTNVGDLAREYFPNGKLAVLGDYPTFESAKLTQEFISHGVETIYEATFIYDNTIVAVDILTKARGKWEVFEVKSTTKVKEQHVEDVAVQYYVINGCNLKIDDVHIMHLNNQYVRKGEIDVRELFTHESVLSGVIDLQEFVKENIEILSEIEKQKKEPIIEMGEHCDKPYSCDFCEYCLSLLPSKNEESTKELSNIPDINEDAIKTFLDEIGYPLYFFDFETIMPAVPMFDNSRPYQQIPFQYSLHYLNKKEGTLEHFEYLAQTVGDPRIELIKQLIKDSKRNGVILVYNTKYVSI